MYRYTDAIEKRRRKLSRYQAMIAATEARHQHFETVACDLGYADSNEAYQAMGKEFVRIARKGAPSITEAVRKAEQQFREEQGVVRLVCGQTQGT